MIKIDRIIKIDSKYYISGIISSDEIIKSSHKELRIFLSENKLEIFSLQSSKPSLIISTNIKQYHFNLDIISKIIKYEWWAKKLFNSLKHKRLSIFKKLFIRKIKFNHLSNNSNISETKILNKPIAVITHSMDRLGAELLSLNMIKTLKTMGYSVITIALNSGELENEFIDHSDVFMDKNSSISSITSILGKFSCTDIICNSVQTGDISFQLAVQGFTIVSLVHELPTAISSLYAKERLINQYRYSKKLIFPTDYVKSEVLSAYKIHENENILVRHQGIYNVMASVDIRTAKQEVEAIIGQNINQPILLGIGNTTSRKGFDIFVETAKLTDYATFIWVGLKVDDYFNKIVKHNFPNNFFFINSTTNLAPFYLSATALLMTSREDPFPSVVLEAASLGRITIGFRDCGGFQDILDSSLLAEKNDIAEFIKIIKYFLSNNGQREILAEKLKHKINKEFSFRKYVEDIINCF